MQHNNLQGIIPKLPIFLPSYNHIHFLIGLIFYTNIHITIKSCSLSCLLLRCFIIQSVNHKELYRLFCLLAIIRLVLKGFF